MARTSDAARDPFTRSLHATVRARAEDAPGFPVASPIWQTATFGFDTPEDAAATNTMKRPSTAYTRYGNPNFVEVESAVATLHGAEAALVTGSGMGAIALLYLGLLAQGDHIVAQTTHYVGTLKWLNRWAPRYGIDVTLVDQKDPSAFEAAIRPSTRLLYAETPVNPKLELTDLAALADLGHRSSIPTCVDNTFATAMNQRPIELGIDLVVESATKFLGGHSDVTAGILCGSSAHMDELWEGLIVHGMVSHPFEAWLLRRGVQSLPFRIDRHNSSAMIIARFLESHPTVSSVHYPGLESHPQHTLAKTQMSGFGGMVAFELADFEAARRFASRLRLATVGVSLGGTHTLVAHAASMVFSHLTSEERTAAGIHEGLIRLSVGLESPEDLIADLEQALRG